MICFYADRASHIRSSENPRDTVEAEYPTNVIELQRHVKGQVEDKSKDSYKRVVENVIGKMRGHVEGQVSQVGGVC